MDALNEYVSTLCSCLETYGYEFDPVDYDSALEAYFSEGGAPTRADDMDPDERDDFWHATGRIYGYAEALGMTAVEYLSHAGVL
jgi:hypothetical protein